MTPQAEEMPGRGGGEGGSGSWPGARFLRGRLACAAFGSLGPPLSTRPEVLSPRARSPLPGRGAGAGGWSQHQVRGGFAALLALRARVELDSVWVPVTSPVSVPSARSRERACPEVGLDESVGGGDPGVRGGLEALTESSPGLLWRVMK